MHLPHITDPPHDVVLPRDVPRKNRVIEPTPSEKKLLHDLGKQTKGLQHNGNDDGSNASGQGSNTPIVNVGQPSNPVPSPGWFGVGGVFGIIGAGGAAGAAGTAATGGAAGAAGTAASNVPDPATQPAPQTQPAPPTQPAPQTQPPGPASAGAPDPAAGGDPAGRCPTCGRGPEPSNKITWRGFGKLVAYNTPSFALSVGVCPLFNDIGSLVCLVLANSLGGKLAGIALGGNSNLNALVGGTLGAIGWTVHHLLPGPAKCPSNMIWVRLF